MTDHAPPTRPHTSPAHARAARRQALRDQAGVTLIEFLMVVVVIAMTASLAVPRLTAARQTTSDAHARAELQSAYEAVSDYYVDQTATAGSTFQGLTATGTALKDVAPDTAKWTWTNNALVTPANPNPKEITIIGGGGTCPTGADWLATNATCTGAASPMTVTLCNAGETMVYCIVDTGSGPKWGAGKNTNPGDVTADRVARQTALANASANAGDAQKCQRAGTVAAMFAVTGQCPVADAGVPVADGAPVPSGAPSVLWKAGGSAQQGQKVQASSAEGVWSNAPTSYTLQWMRCDGSGANCSNVAASCTRPGGDFPAVTACDYTATAADVGSTLRAKVSATNTSGTSYATSPPTDVIVATTPSYVAASTAATAAPASTLTLTKPAGVAAGDVMIAAVAAKDDVALIGPQGWTRLAATSTNGSDHKNATVWHRVVAAGEPADYTWTTTDDSWITIAVSAYRGATQTGLPVVAVQRDLKSADKPLAVPSITPAAGARLITAEFALTAVEAGCTTCSTTMNAPPGMSRRARQTASTTGPLHLASWISDIPSVWPASITTTHSLPNNVIVALVLTP